MQEKRGPVSIVKRILRRMVYVVPGTQALWVRLNEAFAPGPEFSGWGMETNALTPWHAGGGDETARDFLRVNAEVLERVAAGQLVLSQFKDVQDIARTLRQLMWRHYIVFWSVRYAARATVCPVKNLVECGVCDGLSSFFAMSALKGSHRFKAFLYDAWKGMRAQDLLASEHASAGTYSYLSIENTKRNLAAFEHDTIFVDGFIPDVFEQSPTPSDIVWLHIDLNSSMPTNAALNECFERMPPGAVILLDDYAGRGFHDTKIAADKFFEGRRGLLLPMPTGQAMFFKL